MLSGSVHLFYLSASRSQQPSSSGCVRFWHTLFLQLEMA